MSEPNRHTCLACGQPLTVNVIYAVHCPHGPCPSKQSNVGATGSSVDEAINALESKIDAEDLDRTGWGSNTDSLFSGVCRHDPPHVHVTFDGQPGRRLLGT